MRICHNRLIAMVLVLLVGGCAASVPPQQDQPREWLVTGKAISARAESSQDVGSMPINLILSHDGRYAITTDVGFYQSLWSIRTANGKGISEVEFSNAPEAKKSAAPPRLGGEATTEVTAAGSRKSNGLYYGLAIA